MKNKSIENMDGEIWKLHEKSGHMVSNMGRVLTKKTGRIAAHFKNQRYCYYGFFAGHRMVWEAFMGEIPEGYVINHKNYDGNDNRLENLEVCTKSYNILHSFQKPDRKTLEGEKSYNAIITNEHVLEIYELAKQGKSNEFIAEKMGLLFRHVSLIRNGTRWKHLYKIHFPEGAPPSSPGIRGNIDEYLEVLDYVVKNPSATNAQISGKFNLERSMVSRIRAKKTWMKVWELFEKKGGHN